MDLKLSYENICINEVLFKGAIEQPIELDYLLPDYCKSIFKVLKCKIIPKITGERILNGKLIVDGIAYIKVIYICEENYQICCVTQSQIFSKSVDLKEECDDGKITAFVKCDYVNCRAVNQHRLDIRGALSIKCHVTHMKKLKVLSKANGMGVQINNQKITALDRKLTSYKEFSIREELELTYGKTPVSQILDTNHNARLTEYKIIANKVVVKGEILMHMLYTNTVSSPECMDYTIPISQVIDMPNVTEEYQCIANFEVISCDIDLQQDADGEYNRFVVEFSVRVRCEGNKNADTHLITDMYSTLYNLNSTNSHIKTEQLIGTIHENCNNKTTISVPENGLSSIYDVSCNFNCENSKLEDGCIHICGSMHIEILAIDCENIPVIIEKTTECTFKLNSQYKDCSEISFSPFVTVCAVSYHMLSSKDNDNSLQVEVVTDLCVCGSLFETNTYDLIDQVTVDDSCKKEKKSNAVLRLYFANKDEKVWDIAKKFDTSMNSILVENTLQSEKVERKEMLLIPIIE